ncbi:MAG: DUF1598 domain-containing protein [Planctomycetaceae bacterium]|nr:DUF1598 domain-containing protein [Planctomycetaceae bacterium]
MSRQTFRFEWLRRMTFGAAVVALSLCGLAGCGTSVPPTAEIRPSTARTEIPSPKAETASARPAATPVAEKATEVRAARPTIPAGDAVVEADEEEAASNRARVEAQLASGEFGPALETAVAVFDMDERTELLKLVAAAQRKIGDFDAAQATIRLIPKMEDRVHEQGDRAAEAMLAGGNMADFTQLIDLIQNETSGPWMDIAGDGGTISEFNTGVLVDPKGQLGLVTKQEREGRLTALGIRARQADLNEDLAKHSELRMVSLTRLEQEVAKRLAAGQPVLETMKHLAGLSQVQYVFVDRDTREVIIAGPAEGWRYNDNGLPVGVDTGRPTLQLDDLVTVIRTFHEGGLGQFQCLIVPREEGLRDLKAFVAQSTAKGPIPAGAVRNWVAQMQQKLGLQDVVVNGVPGNSRIARVIVEADYRMKLLGIGRLEGGKDIPSYFDLLPLVQPKEVPDMDGLRWWMTMKYEAVLHSPERNVFEIQGSSVKCLSENELITVQGKRIHTGKSEPTNRMFAQNFTNGYPKLAERDIIFADLQNIFDLSLASAIVARERQDHGLMWTPGVFGQGGSYTTASYETPKTVMSAVNHKVYNGKDIVVQVAGGVQADLMSVLKDETVSKEQPRLGNRAKRAKPPVLPEGRWWWDAAN